MASPTHGILIVWLLLEGFFRFVIADLPIHCTLRDIAGDWTFFIGPGAPVNGEIPGCGHHIPNSVEVALTINSTEVVPRSDAQTMQITLTEDISTEPQRHLIARSEGVEGMWTMVFDTGLEARIGDKSLFSHFLFSEIPNASRPAQNGDNFKEVGKYFGRNGDELAPMGKTYACYCNMLTTGFWHRHTSDGKLEAGCFWGAKKESLNPDSTLKEGHAPPTAFVRLSKRKAATHGVALNASISGATSFSVHSAEQVADDDFQSHGALLKEVVYPKRAAPAAEKSATIDLAKSVPKVVSLRGVSMHGHQSKNSVLDVAKNTSSSKNLPIAIPPLGEMGGEKEMPKAFDWREELADMVPKGYDPLGEQVDQGPCGSCYAFAGVMMLQMRFRVQLYRKHGILYPVELSYKTASRCSPYTEGCNGGFSYLTMRLASELGVPEVKCDEKVSAGDLDQSCDWACYKGNKNLFFAKDYWHVGGFSHGSDEKSIMHEIYYNGPVELGFSTSAVPEFVSRSGQSVSNSTETMTIILNDRAPKESYSTNSEIQPWVFSTHAILGVGWGEESVSWGMVKYWTVRNSWGRDWGVNGYSKMRRGNNDGGIETDATMAVPDMDRLPEGFLEKAKAYHEGMADKRAEWKKAPAPKKVTPAKKGTPEYCKQRPDSIDCN
jgi:hypothetical protein